MAGKHLGGSNTLAAFIDSKFADNEISHQFMPKNDSAYAEGRTAAAAGAAQTDNPHGLDHDAALLINQGDAWFCWDNGFDLRAGAGQTPGFQLETATVDP